MNFKDSVKNFAETTRKLTEAHLAKKTKLNAPRFVMKKSSAPTQTQTGPREPRPSPAHSSVKEPSQDLLNSVAERLERVQDATEDGNKHKNLLNAVAQKLDEAKDTVAEKAKEAKEYVEKEATVVNEMLGPAAGE